MRATVVYESLFGSTREVAEAAAEGLRAAAPGAALDTRLTTLFPGSAARLIARSLEDHGYEVITRPEGFLVETLLGPLSAGERDRARAWGSALAGFLRPAHQASSQ